MANRSSKRALAIVPVLGALVLIAILLRPKPPERLETLRPAQLTDEVRSSELPSTKPISSEALPALISSPDRKETTPSPGFEERYGRVLRRFSFASQHPLDAVVGRLQYECYTALREVRLLALCNPKEMHTKSVGI